MACLTLHFRRLRLLAIYSLILLPALVWGATQALRTNTNNPLEWVASTFPARHQYELFCEVFGSGDACIASWPGCTLDNPRLDDVLTALRESPQFRTSDGRRLVDEVMTGREVWQQLTAAPLSIEPEQARERLTGSLIGRDGQTTCVVATLSPQGLHQRRDLVPRIEQVLIEIGGAPPESLHLAGPAIDGHSVDQTSQRSLARLALPSVLASVLMCWWCLRSWRAVFAVCGIAIYCQIAALALIYYSGGSMSALDVVLPPLVQVLAVAGGIHLVNYYLDAAETYGPAEAPRRAFAIGWLPCALSLGTTAAGTASLMTSALSPIRAFGGYASAGVLITLGLLLSLVPAVLTFWPVHGSTQAARDTRRVARKRLLWEVVARIVRRWHVPVAVASCLAMLAAAGGLGGLRTSVRIETLFPPGSRLLVDYAWLEEEIGPLVPMEVILTCDKSCRLSLRDRLARVAAVEHALRQLPEVGTTRSAVTYLPRMPRRGIMLQSFYDQLVKQALERARPRWVEARVLAESPRAQQWRITAQVSALAPIDYGLLLEDVRRQAEPLLRDAQGEPIRGLSLEYTGAMPLVHAIQRRLMNDLFYSYLCTFLVVTLVTTIVQAGILPGLVAMVPNTFPVLMVFGTLGWLGWPMDIGSVMTASIAMGLAVDDTLHFLTFFRRGLDAGLDRFAAVREGYRHSGTAMLQTSLVCGLGILVFAFSDFLPGARFSWMMTLLIAAALYGDLVLLPALLLSPLGRVFFTPPIAQPPTKAAASLATKLPVPLR